MIDSRRLLVCHHLTLGLELAMDYPEPLLDGIGCWLSHSTPFIGDTGFWSVIFGGSDIEH